MDSRQTYTHTQYKQVLLEKLQAEFDELLASGVQSAGYLMSDVLLLCSEQPSEHGLLQGADGAALKAALNALGYAPEDWACVSTVLADTTQMSSALLQQVIRVFDPATLIICDEHAAGCVRESFADELAAQPNLDAAMLAPGVVCYLRGVRMLNLGDFARALDDPKQKQLMWARLKQLPPLGEPY